MPIVRLMRPAGSRCRLVIASVRISCAAESCCALPTQPGERWSCLDRCRSTRCSCDDPPDVNCRAKSYSAADHLINPTLRLETCTLGMNHQQDIVLALHMELPDSIGF